MKVGLGNARFLSDLAENVPDSEMRKRWKAGDYGTPRLDYVKGWRKLNGRSSQ